MLVHVGEHLRLVLELADLLVDLLQGARGGEQILRIIGAVEHGYGMCGDHRDNRRGGKRRGGKGKDKLLHCRYSF